ncbi:MAG TPA: Crp/Fnr family transcriptional regulator [Pseudolabrys sp.]|jgi:CRP-like cAMP-binding protein|nr:Crp/Fnr family transcriptional regulator [Pseudolabrys sp.]
MDDNGVLMLPSDNRILRSLPASDLAELQAGLKQVTLMPGTALYKAGSEIEHVHFPSSGVVSVVISLKTGQEIATGIVGNGGVVGTLIGNAGRLAFGQATVQIEGAAWQLPRAKFLAVVNKSAAVRALANEFEGYLYWQAQQCVACHAVHTVEARLCRWLLQCQDVTESEIIPLTQENLSQLMGVRRNSVSLSAHELQTAGIIQYRRGSIRIVNREALERAACECYEAVRGYASKMTPPLCTEQVDLD